MNGESSRLFDLIIQPRFSKWAFVYASVGLCFSMLLTLQAWMLSEPLVPVAVVVIVLICLLPLGLWMNAAIKTLKKDGITVPILWKGSSNRLKTVGVALSAVCGVTILLGIAGVIGNTNQGIPTRSAGHFYLENHGPKVEVTRATYFHAVALIERLFSGVSSWFYFIGVVLSIRIQNQR